MKNLMAVLLLSSAMSVGPAVSSRAQTAPPTPPSASPAPEQPPEASPVSEAAASLAGASDDARRATRMADRAALFEAHLAAMHAGLTLNPDQDKLWPAVEQAIRGYAKMRAGQRDRRMDVEQDREEEREVAGPDHEDPIAALKRYSEDTLERAQAVEAVSDAVEPLYATLSADQKNRIPMLLRVIAPQHGPVARLADRFEEASRTEERPRDAPPPRRGDRFEQDGQGEDGPAEWRGGDHGRGDRDGPRFGMRGDERDGMTMHRRHRDGPPMPQDERGEDEGQPD